VNAIKKRASVRNASRASHLKPVRRRGGMLDPFLSKKRRLSAAEIESDLRRICKGAPSLDAQAVLDDLRE
jgi:hypothetical protein